MNYDCVFHEMQCEFDQLHQQDGEAVTMTQQMQHQAAQHAEQLSAQAREYATAEAQLNTRTTHVLGMERSQFQLEAARRGAA